uniref:Uncharacterized protein n=1 Tax=Peronospora matthiolae TaxID=2874970 RepID=A0AAV1UJI0_9STRA
MALEDKERRFALNPSDTAGKRNQLPQKLDCSDSAPD